MATEEEMFAAFEEYLECKIKELINNRLGAGSIEDRIATTNAKDRWLALIK